MMMMDDDDGGGGGGDKSVYTLCYVLHGREVLFKTCVAMKFVDDDDDDVCMSVCLCGLVQGDH